MRRQARNLEGGARRVRTASALQAWLWLLIFIFQNESTTCKSIQPGYLDFDNLPDTNFTCEGKVIGGYYADLETSCQMFHVCTVGQQDEPMDIKFLCLNGTVFDQETRVCERVDEVDCTKSENFYSLNLELYGNTIAPPSAKANETKPQTTTTTAAGDEDYDEPKDHLENTNPQKDAKHPDYQDTTEEPESGSKNYNNHNVQNGYPDVHATNPSSPGFSDHVEPIEENHEEEEIDSEIPEYEEDYPQSSPSTTTSAITDVVSTTSKATPTTTIILPQPSFPQSASYQPSVSSLAAKPTTTQLSSSQGPASPTLDPALLSPQEFIYRHRGPSAEAISFQRQGFRPADGVYITHAPTSQSPQISQYDQYQYESSRTAPRPVVSQKIPYSNRPVPTPFRATTLDPHDQLSRPGPSSQSSERHETSIKSRPYLPPPPTPSQRPYAPQYYDRKRSDDLDTGSKSTLSARSVAPPVNAERPPSKLKSPPRVIVTASASVSDSNGKRLNYTVGNVVSAVKPIVPINYDDYKESDLIFDPFFLDVPKLSKGRKNRESNQLHPGLIRMYADIPITTPSVSSQASASKKDDVFGSKLSTSTAAWSPYDYVDDNYEAQAFVPPANPLAIINMPFDRNKSKNERHSHNVVNNKRFYSAHRNKPSSIEESKAASHTTQLSSSHIAEASATIASPSSLIKPNCTSTLSLNCGIHD